ncbi:hypothetical protein ACVWW6_008759 [Bradyrhizobium sp. USDA 3311]|uniref:hypothetical protein n=1 Tax=Bradyrhizobium TaxID=374 RepID=UPI001177F586|nr:MULTISPECIES: hypothetical protein [Bradyrhizobium]QHP73060.1 hypothetical protein EI171_40695 [Bradyrhizobium sp. LCT2]
MSGVGTIELDLAKYVFQVHGSGVSAAVIFRKQLRRDKVLKFFATQSASTVAMEALASSHHWGERSQNWGIRFASLHWPSLKAGLLRSQDFRRGTD